MSIANEITRLREAKDDLKTSINAKNTSSNQITNETIDDYASFVDLIPQEFTPTGTIEITENGVYNVSSFASANVNIDTGIVDNGPVQGVKTWILHNNRVNKQDNIIVADIVSYDQDFTKTQIPDGHYLLSVFFRVQSPNDGDNMVLEYSKVRDGSYDSLNPYYKEEVSGYDFGTSKTQLVRIAYNASSHDQLAFRVYKKSDTGLGVEGSVDITASLVKYTA